MAVLSNRSKATLLARPNRSVGAVHWLWNDPSGRASRPELRGMDTDVTGPTRLRWSTCKQIKWVVMGFTLGCCAGLGWLTPDRGSEDADRVAVGGCRVGERGFTGSRSGGARATPTESESQRLTKRRDTRHGVSGMCIQLSAVPDTPCTYVVRLYVYHDAYVV